MSVKNKKRKKIIVGTSVVLAVILASYCFFEVASPRYIDYGIDKPPFRFYLNDYQTISLYCNNLGDKSADFNLVLRLTNASFSNQTEQPYEFEDESSVKFPFFLSSGKDSKRNVIFTINENVSYFSFTLSLEKCSLTPYISTFSSFASYKWNQTERCYEFWRGMGGSP